MDRNLVLALVLTALILIGWDQLVAGPQREAAEALRREAGIELAEQAERAGVDVTRELDAPAVDATLSRVEALALAPGRVPIDTPAITGSINLRGALLDDVTLKRYRITPDEDAPLVQLLSPQAVEGAQYVIPGIGVNGERGGSELWSAPEGARLTPDSPVTLTREADGVAHALTFSIDERYLISTEHTVTNRSAGAAILTPFGITVQRGIPGNLRKGAILFEGPIAVAADAAGKVGLEERKYGKIVKKGGFGLDGRGGWVGLTSKYWLTAAVPPQDTEFEARVRNLGDAENPVFTASYDVDPIALPAGQQATVGGDVFVGPKRVSLLKDYEAREGIVGFDRAIDWGFLWFLTRPIFAMLSFFAGIVGNWGVAILLLTLVIKGALFPLASASYRSMARMRNLSPEIAKLKERHPDDQVKMQQEMMALYKREKVNPAAGCVPILAQMPIFFALYKVLFTTIELRHQPFLYIRDLSEQDPTTIFNLFGLLPFDPTVAPVIGAFLGIGILPFLMGIAMWVQTKLNPPPPDPMQARIFGLMPIFFVFIFAPFAAGLVLYWFWNTLLGVIQQYVIMRRAGADVNILGNMKNTFRRKPKAEPAAETPAE